MHGNIQSPLPLEGCCNVVALRYTKDSLVWRDDYALETIYQLLFIPRDTHCEDTDSTGLHSKDASSYSFHITSHRRSERVIGSGATPRQFSSRPSGKPQLFLSSFFWKGKQDSDYFRSCYDLRLGSRFIFRL